LRKKRFGRTLLTEEEVKVLDALLRYGNVSEAAKELGKAQPTVSIVKRRIEDKIDMAIETLKLALSKDYVSVDELLRLIASTEKYMEIIRRLSEAAEKKSLI